MCFELVQLTVVFKRKKRRIRSKEKIISELNEIHLLMVKLNMSYLGP